MKAPDCGFPYDGENEGHAGSLAVDYALRHSVANWLSANPAEIIIIHLGTNDIMQRKPLANITSAYDVILSDARAHNRRIKIVLSQLIPLDEAKFGKDRAEGIKELNKALVKWGRERSTIKSPIWVVDQHTGFDTKTDTKDGEHPNAKGDLKMSERFLPVVKDAMEAVRYGVWRGHGWSRGQA